MPMSRRYAAWCASPRSRAHGAKRRETLGCRVRFRQTWCGFELPHRLADRRIESADPETRRIAAKYLESNYLPRTASLSLQLRAPDQTGTPTRRR
jgi:hypothetical protein